MLEKFSYVGRSRRRRAYSHWRARDLLINCNIILYDRLVNDDTQV